MINHFILLPGSIISIELLLRLNFISHLNVMLSITKRIAYIVPNRKISDHWKEKIIPIYAFKIIRASVQILFISICIAAFFLISNILFDDFLKSATSMTGLIESSFFLISFFHLRKLVAK